MCPQVPNEGAPPRAVLGLKPLAEDVRPARHLGSKWVWQPGEDTVVVVVVVVVVVGICLVGARCCRGCACSVRTHVICTDVIFTRHIDCLVICTHVAVDRRDARARPLAFGALEVERLRHPHEPKVQQRAARFVVGGRHLGSCLKCTPQRHGHGVHFTRLLGAREASDAKGFRAWRRTVMAAGSLAANTAVLALSQPRLGTDAAQPTQPHRAIGSRRHAYRARGCTETELTASDGRHTPCVRLVRTHGSPHASTEELHAARVRRAAVEAQAAVRGPAAGLHRV